MTTLLAPVDALSRNYAVARESHLLDRFWDAVVLPSSEPVNIRDSLCSIEETIYEHGIFQSPEIFSKSGSHPVINVKLMRSPTLGGCEAHHGIDSFQLPSTQFSYRPYCGPIQVDRNALAQPPRITFQPAAVPLAEQASARRLRRPNVAIPNHRPRQSNAVSSPGAALLARASNFLGLLSKLGRSQPSTPVPKDSGIQIVDSAVVISVVDDVLRGRPSSRGSVDWQYDQPLSSTRSPLSPNTAEEMDLLAKIGWETQLMNAQEHSSRL